MGANLKKAGRKKKKQGGEKAQKRKGKFGEL